MPDNFRDFHEQLERNAPIEDLELQIMQQANNFSVFGKVVELFVPDALQTAARLIGGDSGPSVHGGARGLPDEIPDWRRPPNT